MHTYDRARQLAGSGRYENVQAVMWTLYKEGHSLVGAKIGLWQRMKLNRLCRNSRRETIREEKAAAKVAKAAARVQAKADRAAAPKAARRISLRRLLPFRKRPVSR